MGEVAKVAMYVQTEYAKKTYSVESYNVRMFPGSEMVIHELVKNGIRVDYCSSANVEKYKVVLVSITSQCDWLSFCSERITWKKGEYKVIIGGFGVLNYKPFVSLADYFYFGRSENDIHMCVNELLESGEMQQRQHIVDVKSIKSQYFIRQALTPYQDEYVLSNGEKFCESVIGCQRKCLFCSYTWHRKFTGGLQKDSGVFRGDSEKTMFEIIAGDHTNLSALRMVGLDGISQRIRYNANKRISNDDVVSFFKVMNEKSKPHHVKFYNICGYWDENDEDYKDFAEVIKEIDMTINTGKWCIELHSTPFRPMPATPLSHKPTQYYNFRKNISKKLRKHTGYMSDNSVFYNGKNIFALETMGTESLSTVIIDMIVLRGCENDGENFKKLASTKKFNTLDTTGKIKTLEKYFDVNKLFGMYDNGTLPTEYLKSYVDVSKILVKS
jgi:radical SAM superfamily enzyme YgiQ (UPF0313 family)